MNLWFVLHVVGTRMSAQVRPPRIRTGTRLTWISRASRWFETRLCADH
jgi:hypothetical protein